MNFFSLILHPSFHFLRNAIFAALFSSILFGILGPILTVKRMIGLAGAISHAVLGGIGLALFFSTKKIIPGFSPLLGAFIFSILSAFIIGFVYLKAGQKSETSINAIWAVGMSIGVVFIAKTPGFIDPFSYLFGNILFVSDNIILLLMILDILVIFLLWRFYPQILSVSFDEEFSKVRNIPVETIFIVLLSVTALAIVLLQISVGIIMLIAMFALPSGIFIQSSKNLAQVIFLSSIFSFIVSITGLWSGWVLDLPAGAVTVLIAGVVFLFVSVIRVILKKV